MLRKKQGEDIIHRRLEIKYFIGDRIKVIEGAFLGFDGSISEVKPEKRKIRVLVPIFGRYTPVELDYNQIEPLS